MDEHEENFKDIFRYTDVEYTPDGYTDVYRWDDFLVIAGDHVYSAMDTIDSVSEGAFLRLLGTVSVFMRRARRFPAGPAFPWVSLMADAFLGSRETLGGSG